MKQFIVATLISIGIFTLGATKVNAQMMDFSNSTPSNSDIQSQQQEEQTGKSLLDQLTKSQITCQKLTDSDFEKIGEYFMGQSIGDTSRHVVTNNLIKSMMGEQREEQMHLAWGKRGSGCDSNYNFTVMGGGVFYMMGNYYGMNGGVLSVFAWITWVLVIITLALLTVWLWKQIQHPKK